MSNTFMSEEEIQTLTGFKHPNRQVEMLHLLGFTRAHKTRAGRVVLERAHFEAVSQGNFIKTTAATSTGSRVKTEFLGARA
jgi:hypothetical protein